MLMFTAHRKFGYPNNTDALDALCDVAKQNHDWQKLYAYSQRGILASEDLWKRNRFTASNVLALIHLRNLEKAKSVCETLPAEGRYGSLKKAYQLLILFWQGDYPTAVNAAQELLSQEKVIFSAKAIAKMVSNQALKLGYDLEAQKLSDHELYFLKNNGLEDYI